MRGAEGITCEELVELLTAYLEGAIPPDTSARIEAHLATCAGCDAVIRQMRDTIRITGMLDEDGSVPEPQRTKILRAFRGWKAERVGEG